MPQDHPTDNPILKAARRELTERAQTTAPLRTADDAYSGSARIVSINTSAHKGTRKTPVADGHDTVIKQFGLASDAHAGHWHRQVSFLSAESINTARTRGLDVREGDFGENFTTQGINLLSLPLGTQLKLGSEVLVEISQIGKVCHTRCAIYYLAGDCIFPHEGIFGVVLQGGEVHIGDDIQVVKLGDGTCSFTPAEALKEVEQARRDGTL
ncbi:MOSC domain-containing protein [Collinsella sp. AF29-7AC]|uniref:MOSC domain-containing protein n=1 Tax=Collinsella sp. AF29-7AC TaxID=2292010 RepID=UPI0018F5EF55|nr:MOSC domain-containing protein [Collinsella sp. AF29-7AC]